ncbi:MFS general substrate transporter [Mytilinidion resinicola]|uniref:MFS general substrate transporter n=1 Tax=Mytilinidion resinicola TaxID=574789 RepID=A0A6A6YHM6_9PEZI|nr:MFS general substrate transporter [Mytilinidion resinicola]KAF2807397.1 MFS general substrate transporter [Mytilinidion resinicola]
MASSRERDSFDDSSPTTPLLPRSPTSPSFSAPKHQKPWILVAVIGALAIFIVDLGNFLLNPARTRLYESSICLRFYQDTDPSQIRNGTIQERLCKINEVQDTVAMVFGWQDLFDAIPGILLAVPYGALADKYGRKWILVLGFLGLELSMLWIMLICYLDLQLKLTWFSSIFLMIGGGSTVAIATVFTMLSDVVPPERRTTIFFYVGATLLVSEVIAPAIGFWLMKYGDWLTFCVGAAISGLAVVLACFLPETLHSRDQPELPDDRLEDEVDDLAERTSMSSGKGHGHGFKDQIHRLRETLHFLKKDLSLTLVVFTFLVNRLARQSQDLVIRYASKRYGWTIRQASLLNSLRASFNLLTLVVLLPGISMLLLKWIKLAPQRGDLWISRGSIAFTVLSFLIMGFSFTPAILIWGLIFYTFGSGFSMAMRSIAVFMVGGQASKDIGRLFAVVAILESCGLLISGPLIAQFFRWGMKLGNAWLGMPFLLSAALFLPVLVITYCISLRDISAVPHAVHGDQADANLPPYTDEE